MTDWKARCAELEGLLSKLHELVHADGRFLLDEDSGAGSYGVELDISIDESLTRTRAELAKPEPEGPTNEELTSFAIEWWASFAYLKRDADEATPINKVIHSRHFVDFLKDAFARFPICKASDQ